MKRKILFSIFGIFTLLLAAYPAFALSSLAEDFLKACQSIDSPWPPENWSKQDLRAAALEVLDATENGRVGVWPRTFCIEALGSVQNPDDLPRILNYEDKMNYTVLKSLKGFAHPDAINCLLKYIDNEKPPKRELAIKGLAEVDFKKLDKPEQWKTKVKDAIKKALGREKVAWLKKDMQSALDKVEKAKIK